MSTPPVTITVRGHARRQFAPNRCTVRVRVSADGSSRAAAADRADTAVREVTDIVTTLHDRPASPVSRWTFDQVQHSRHRPYDRDGKKRAWQYYSSATITVTFVEFEAIAPFVAQVADVESVTVGHLDWWLTRKATLKRTARVRDQAVLDALAKAKGYTASLGYNTFHAVAIADPGMLGIVAAEPHHERIMATPPAAMGLPADMGGEDQRSPSLRPERISISASVEARFEALMPD